MTERFYGEKRANAQPILQEYERVGTPQRLFDLLWEVWCRETCAPRLREQWREDNRTLGQCSITSFLVQDIYGGEVYGVPLAGGGFHCFNVVDGVAFDLTDGQFGGEKLRYDLLHPQSREEHFADREKYERYLLLKSKLSALLK